MPVKTTLKWKKDLQKFIKKVKSRPKRVLKAMKGAMFEEANELITEAKRLVPVDEGVLKSSGFAKNPTVKGKVVKAVVGFGGPAGSGNVGGETNDEDIGYAVRVHEDLTAHHTVGQAKFLEQPLLKRAQTVSRRLADRAKARLKK